MHGPIIYKGIRFRIVFASLKSGERPGERFFDALSMSDKAKLISLFRLAGDLGELRNPEKFGDLGNGLYEFKSHQIRMPFQYSRRERGVIVITHGFVKKKDKTPPEEIAGARRYFEEDQADGGLTIAGSSKQ